MARRGPPASWSPGSLRFFIGTVSKAVAPQTPRPHSTTLRAAQNQGAYSGAPVSNWSPAHPWTRPPFGWWETGALFGRGFRATTSRATFPPYMLSSMPRVPLPDVIHHADRLLHPERFSDYDGALNGLQFENRGHVSRIAAAVDATVPVVQLAIAAGADLLVVHHGLFWGPNLPWTGRRAAMIRLLVEHDLAVYSQHLPLDGHPVLGNAAQLGRALGFRRLRPFFARKEAWIGVQTELSRPLPLVKLAERLGQVLGSAPKVLPGGPSQCRRIGICTGGAGSEIAQAAGEGIDTFITGEGPHWTYALAEDHGVNALYGGHYATETFGVKALAKGLAQRFKLPWVFVDHPTGL